mmetsp:Transcript_56554/g.104679  ORF Transcript_56554/g.104679 Transcript_56554/m.104679 type:complete len:267 (-) Transcript_56554:181-981(-)
MAKWPAGTRKTSYKSRPHKVSQESNLVRYVVSTECADWQVSAWPTVVSCIERYMTRVTYNVAVVGLREHRLVHGAPFTHTLYRLPRNVWGAGDEALVARNKICALCGAKGQWSSGHRHSCVVRSDFGSWILTLSAKVLFVCRHELRPTNACRWTLDLVHRPTLLELLCRRDGIIAMSRLVLGTPVLGPMMPSCAVRLSLDHLLPHVCKVLWKHLRRHGIIHGHCWIVHANIRLLQWLGFFHIELSFHPCLPWLQIRLHDLIARQTD